MSEPVEPVDSSEAEPVDAPEAEPVDAPEAEPVDAPEAEPVDAPEAEPASEAEPADASRAEPVDASRAEPVDASKDENDGTEQDFWVATILQKHNKTATGSSGDVRGNVLYQGSNESKKHGFERRAVDADYVTQRPCGRHIPHEPIIVHEIVPPHKRTAGVVNDTYEALKSADSDTALFHCSEIIDYGGSERDPKQPAANDHHPQFRTSWEYSSKKNEAKSEFGLFAKNTTTFEQVVNPHHCPTANHDVNKEAYEVFPGKYTAIDIEAATNQQKIPPISPQIRPKNDLPRSISGVHLPPLSRSTKISHSNLQAISDADNSFSKEVYELREQRFSTSAEEDDHFGERLAPWIPANVSALGPNLRKKSLLDTIINQAEKAHKLGRHNTEANPAAEEQETVGCVNPFLETAARGDGNSGEVDIPDSGNDVETSSRIADMQPIAMLTSREMHGDRARNRPSPDGDGDAAAGSTVDPATTTKQRASDRTLSEYTDITTTFGIEDNWGVHFLPAGNLAAPVASARIHSSSCGGCMPPLEVIDSEVFSTGGKYNVQSRLTETPCRDFGKFIQKELQSAPLSGGPVSVAVATDAFQFDAQDKNVHSKERVAVQLAQEKEKSVMSGDVECQPQSPRALAVETAHSSEERAISSAYRDGAATASGTTLVELGVPQRHPPQPVADTFSASSMASASLSRTGQLVQSLSHRETKIPCMQEPYSSEDKTSGFVSNLPERLLRSNELWDDFITDLYTSPEYLARLQNPYMCHFASWITTIVVVDFDINEGHLVALEYPPNVLTDSEKERLVRMSLPDSGAIAVASRQANRACVGQERHGLASARSLRKREAPQLEKGLSENHQEIQSDGSTQNARVNRKKRSPSLRRAGGCGNSWLALRFHHECVLTLKNSSLYDHRFSLGAAVFRSVADRTNRRGARQEALVVLSPLSPEYFYPFLLPFTQFVARHYFSHGPAAVYDACACVGTWPSSQDALQMVPSNFDVCGLRYRDEGTFKILCNCDASAVPSLTSSPTSPSLHSKSAEPWAKDGGPSATQSDHGTKSTGGPPVLLLQLSMSNLGLLISLELEDPLSLLKVALPSLASEGLSCGIRTADVVIGITSSTLSPSTKQRRQSKPAGTTLLRERAELVHICTECKRHMLLNCKQTFRRVSEWSPAATMMLWSLRGTSHSRKPKPNSPTYDTLSHKKCGAALRSFTEGDDLLVQINAFAGKHLKAEQIMDETTNGRDDVDSVISSVSSLCENDSIIRGHEVTQSDSKVLSNKNSEISADGNDERIDGRIEGAKQKVPDGDNSHGHGVGEAEPVGAHGVQTEKTVNSPFVSPVLLKLSQHVPAGSYTVDGEEARHRAELYRSRHEERKLKQEISSTSRLGSLRYALNIVLRHIKRSFGDEPQMHFKSSVSSNILKELVGDNHSTDLPTDQDTEKIRERPFDIREKLCGTESLVLNLKSPSFISTFGPLCKGALVLWELVITGHPLLLLSEDATRCSAAALALFRLIRPLRYCGDFRPYLNPYDADVPAYRELLTASVTPAHSNQPNTPPPFLIASSDPLMLSVLGETAAVVVIDSPCALYPAKPSNSAPAVAYQTPLRGVNPVVYSPLETDTGGNCSWLRVPPNLRLSTPSMTKPEVLRRAHALATFGPGSTDQMTSRTSQSSESSSHGEQMQSHRISKSSNHESVSWMPTTLKAAIGSVFASASNMPVAGDITSPGRRVDLAIGPLTSSRRYPHSKNRVHHQVSQKALLTTSNEKSGSQEATTGKAPNGASKDSVTRDTVEGLNQQIYDFFFELTVKFLAPFSLYLQPDLRQLMSNPLIVETPKPPTFSASSFLAGVQAFSASSLSSWASEIAAAGTGLSRGLMSTVSSSDTVPVTVTPVIKIVSPFSELSQSRLVFLYRRFIGTRSFRTWFAETYALRAAETRRLHLAYCASADLNRLLPRLTLNEAADACGHLKNLLRDCPDGPPEHITKVQEIAARLKDAIAQSFQRNDPQVPLKQEQCCAASSLRDRPKNFVSRTSPLNSSRKTPKPELIPSKPCHHCDGFYYGSTNYHEQPRPSTENSFSPRQIVPARRQTSDPVALTPVTELPEPYVGETVTEKLHTFQLNRRTSRLSQDDAEFVSAESDLGESE